MSNKEDGIQAKQILLPLTMVSCAVFGLLAFNTVQMVQGHEALTDVISKQDKPLEEAKKIENQLTALALGTKHLAEAGNSNAQGIVDTMQKAGITINDQQSSGNGASSSPARSPVPFEKGAPVSHAPSPVHPSPVAPPAE